MSLKRLPVPTKVNSLTPLYFVSKTPDKLAHWVCRCDCGTLCERNTTVLRRGLTKSCGCKHYSAVAAGISHALMKHNHSQGVSPEYQAWKNMRGRCNNKNDTHYAQYGGRGIVVCDRWNEFTNFLADMGHRPLGKTSLDRIDVDKGYGPGNCEWSDSHQQARHRTDNVLITHDGRTQCLSDWAAEVGLERKVIQRRLKKGWSTDRAFSEPLPEAYVRAWETRRANQEKKAA